VVLDNLPAHKVAGVREAVAERRARIFYLPPYSPDLYSIEVAFSKLKALIRHEPPRSIDSLVERIGLLFDRFVPTEYANLFHAVGYQRL
jgi:transposase